MSAIERLYTTGLRIASLASPLLAQGDGKLARGIRGRREAAERIERWATARRLPGVPLVWFHAPSVGEGLQARAVMEVLRRERPDLQLGYTFFSPSAESFATRLPVDVADYLPLDLPETVDRVLDALVPDAIVFSKTEVWPNLTERATRRAIPVVLLSATLPPSSSRLRRVARGFLAPSHARLTRVAAISQADADRFELLGVEAGQRMVMGDARFDQVWRRAETARDSPLVQALTEAERLTIVAGSTWPEDEGHLVTAFSRLRAKNPQQRMIIAPHEPTARHLSALEERLGEAGLESIRLGELAPDRRTAANAGFASSRSGAGVVVVDRVGVLGDLYALADVAYVGGGFGDAGLHSVLEPAAFGVPVLFGPRHANAREAEALITVGGAMSVIDTDALADALASWMTDAELRRAAGEAAREYVRQGIGAAERGAGIVLNLLRR